MKIFNTQMLAMLWFGLIGAAIGSFLNVVIYRIPRGFYLNLPSRSFCRNCLTQLTWYENIPLISYWLLRARCRHCKSKIAIRYWLVELLTAALFMAVYANFGLSSATLFYSLLVALLVAITFIDIDFRIIPDVISIPFTVFALVIVWFFYREHFLDHILATLSGSLFFAMIAYFYEKVRKQEGLGFGDVKLIAMIGAFLGLRPVLLTIILSSFIGSAYGILLIVFQKKNLQHAVPYGPFLALGALVSLFWGNELIVRFLY